jgi:thiamine-phosphate pyrophosphorylase
VLSSACLRILDANANRAREGLRVLEDYARFSLDSERLCASLKSLRHELAQALGPYLQHAILHRDTPGDVGTRVKTSAELSREGLPQVLIAAGKRVGEALRVLEEVLKTDSPEAGSVVEKLRYGFYGIEQSIALTLNRGRRFQDVRLYVLITESLCKKPWLEVAADVIEGGADCIQLREKELEGAEFLRRARAMVALCRGRGVLSIINDRPDIAMLSGADGVHVGQGDLPCREVRRLVGPDMIVGVSTHEIDQAKRAMEEGADYIGVGPVFSSSTKPRDFLPGLEYARQVVQSIPLAAVAIAGITEQNLESLLATGIKAIAVTAAAIACDDPQAATARLKAMLVRPGLPSATTAPNAGCS